MATEGARLAGAGLDEASESLYRAVLARQVVVPAELAAELDQPVERVARVLAKLHRLGLVTRLAGRQRRYAATDPRSAVESLVRARESELNGARAAVDQLAELFRSGAERSLPAGPVQLLTGREALGRWFARLQQEATREVLALDRPPYALAPSNQIEPVSLARGVQWRTIYAPEALEMPGALAEIRQLIAGGEKARVLPELGLKLAIADRRVALLPLSLDMTEVQAVVVHESTLLQGLLELFECYWQRAVPLPGSDVTDQPPELNEDDRAILHLLLSGLKDEAIARQLGWSLRTMRRRIRRLLDLLGAENRFQAGVMAVRRGWM